MSRDKSEEALVLKKNISDHDAVKLTIECNLEKKEPKIIVKTDWQLFRSLIVHSEINQCFSTSDVNEKFNLLQNTLISCLEQSKEIKVFNKIQKNKTWVTEELRQSCKEKKILYKNTKRDPTTKEQYKEFLKKHKK